MWETLSQWEAKYVVMLAGVVALAAIVIAVAGFGAWRRVKIAGIEADLKRDAMNRGFNLEQIERLINGPDDADEPVDEKAVEADLASVLVQYEVPTPTLEQVLQLFHTAPARSKSKIYEAIGEMLEAEATSETLIAAVRTLCQPERRGDPAVALAP